MLGGRCSRYVVGRHAHRAWTIGRVLLLGRAYVTTATPRRQESTDLLTTPATRSAPDEGAPGDPGARGGTGVAMCSALNWYLKYYCNASASWRGNQLKLPDPLPEVERKIRKTSPYKFRYLFNYCTFSYTLASWDWEQWQEMIDWMALNGINMPLAVTGQEIIWQNVSRELGLSDEQIHDFFVGAG